MHQTPDWLVHDHHKYDAALAECEAAAGAGQWKEAVRLFYELVEDLKLHMRMEDEVLYPLFEETGDPEGAIAELSEEHDDLVRLLHDLAHVIKTNDFDHFLESLVPLRKAMARHNEHEEDVFRRKADTRLLMRRDEILARLDAVQQREGRRTWDL